MWEAQAANGVPGKGDCSCKGREGGGECGECGVFQDLKAHGQSHEAGETAHRTSGGSPGCPSRPLLEGDGSLAEKRSSPGLSSPGRVGLPSYDFAISLLGGNRPLPGSRPPLCVLK